MDTLKCIVVDDEPMALKLMESYVDKTPFLSLEKTCSSGFQVLDYLNTNRVDVIFLDIQMPGLNGVELSKILPSNTRVIFTTAFNEYAVQGFKVEALDYLLKPISYEEFLVSANKAKEWFLLLEKSKSAQQPDLPGFIFIKSDYKQIKIKLDDILYVEGLKDYVKVWVTTQDKPFLTLMTLKKMESQLGTSKFMRIHRSFIIALHKIDEIERNQVIINKKRITISEPYRDTFQQFISNNSF